MVSACRSGARYGSPPSIHSHTHTLAPTHTHTSTPNITPQPLMSLKLQTPTYGYTTRPPQHPTIAPALTHPPDPETRELSKIYFKLIQAVHHKRIIENAQNTGTPPLGLLRQITHFTDFIKPASPSTYTRTRIQDTTHQWMLNILAILHEHYFTIIDTTDVYTLNHLALHIAIGWARKRYKTRLTAETLQEVQQLFQNPPTISSTSLSEDYSTEQQTTPRRISTETQTTPTHTADKVISTPIPLPPFLPVYKPMDNPTNPSKTATIRRGPIKPPTINTSTAPPPRKDLQPNPDKILPTPITSTQKTITLSLSSPHTDAAVTRKRQAGQPLPTEGQSTLPARNMAIMMKGLNKVNHNHDITHSEPSSITPEEGKLSGLLSSDNHNNTHTTSPPFPSTPSSTGTSSHILDNALLGTPSSPSPSPISASTSFPPPLSSFLPPRPIYHPFPRLR